MIYFNQSWTSNISGLNFSQIHKHSRIFKASNNIYTFCITFKKKRLFLVSFWELRSNTCYDVEAALSMGEADVVGDEGGVGVRLHAGVPGLQQLQAPTAVLQQARADVGHRGRDGRHGEAHHRVQLRDHVAQRLEGVHVAWRRRRRPGLNSKADNPNPSVS